MARTADSLILEADYWKAILGELRTLNDLMLELSRSIAAQSVPLVHVATQARTAADTDALDRLVAGSREAMALVGRLNEPLDAMLSLATGRGKILTDEAEGLTEPGDD